MIDKKGLTTFQQRKVSQFYVRAIWMNKVGLLSDRMLADLQEEFLRRLGWKSDEPKN